VRHRHLAPLLTVATVLAAGFIWIWSTRPAAPVAAITQPGTAIPGSLPPSFSAQTLGGQTFDLASTRGKPVVLNFFATWCSNCRVELPLLEHQYERLHPAGLQVVTVDFNDSGDVGAFVAPFALQFPVLLDPTSVIGKAYGINDLPVTVFIAANGKVTGIFHGQLSQPTLDEELQGMQSVH
jgi:peroxiredoxin